MSKKTLKDAIKEDAAKVVMMSLVPTIQDYKDKLLDFYFEEEELSEPDREKIRNYFVDVYLAKEAYDFNEDGVKAFKNVIDEAEKTFVSLDCFEKFIVEEEKEVIVQTEEKKLLTEEHMMKKPITTRKRTAGKDFIPLESEHESKIIESS